MKARLIQEKPGPVQSTRNHAFLLPSDVTDIAGKFFPDFRKCRMLGGWHGAIMVTIRKWPRGADGDHADLFASEDPRLIAESLKRIAETSQCDGTPYERAIKILSDHVTQNAAVLSTRQHQIIEEVKDGLRDLFTVRS